MCGLFGNVVPVTFAKRISVISTINSLWKPMMVMDRRSRWQSSRESVRDSESAEILLRSNQGC